MPHLPHMPNLPKPAKLPKLHRLAAGLVVLPLALGLAGCTKEMKKSDLEGVIKARWTEKAGSPPSSVSCPSGLKGTVGTVVQCAVTASNGKHYIMDATVDAVRSGKAHYELTMDKNSPDYPTSSSSVNGSSGGTAPTSSPS